LGRQHTKLAEDTKQMNMTEYVINQPVAIEETRYYEFKEIKGDDPVSIIKNTCDEYVVAFLNSGGGRIYWGIRDSDRVVVGVRLNHRERDRLRRAVTDQLGNIKPPISPSAYQVNLNQVLDDNRQPIEDCFVIEIVVPKPLSNELYCTGSNEVYLKTDSGKKKLSIPEIQDEVLRRKLSPETVPPSYLPPKAEELKPSLQILLRYDRNGMLLLDEMELEAIAREAIFAIENGQTVSTVIEFAEIDLLEKALQDYKNKELPPQERIMKVAILKRIKFLTEQKERLKRALDVVFAEPVFSYCGQSHYMARIWRGLGRRLLGKSSWGEDDIFVPLDLWYRDNNKIYAVIYVELNSNDERQLYNKFIGSGWDLYDLPGYVMFEYAIPAIVLEYLQLKEQKKFENIDEILHLTRWNIGLR